MEDSTKTRNYDIIARAGGRLGPGGLRGLQIRREACVMSSVGSTPIRSRHVWVLFVFIHKISLYRN